MVTERLIVRDQRVKAAQKIADMVFPSLNERAEVFTIGIGGESGSGKTEIADALYQEFANKSISAIRLSQDDYFIYPPKRNELKRRDDIRWVGMNEVRLGLITQNLIDIKAGKSYIVKPKVVYLEDKFVEESINTSGVRVIILDGTYVTILNGIDLRIFIDLTYIETMEFRKFRAREVQDEFLEQVLAIEHEIIAPHKNHAHLILNRELQIEKP